MELRSIKLQNRTVLREAPNITISWSLLATSESIDRFAFEADAAGDAWRCTFDVSDLICFCFSHLAFRVQPACHRNSLQYFGRPNYRRSNLADGVRYPLLAVRNFPALPPLAV